MIELEGVSDRMPRLDIDTYARRLLTAQILQTDLGVIESARVEPALQTAPGPRGLPIIDWTAVGVDGLAPRVLPLPLPPAGAPSTWLEHAPLPKADVVVITWTSAEWDALHYVFANELEPLPESPSNNSRWRSKWRPYRRDFYRVFQPLWTRRLIASARNRSAGAPALLDGRWGSYTLVSVGAKTVLLFKSELHINQDGETLPLDNLVRAILDECQPDLVLSIGTAGGVRPTDVLGDVVVTNAAKFRCGDEFETAAFNGEQYASQHWVPPATYVPQAIAMMMEVAEFDLLPPTAHYQPGVVVKPSARRPTVHLLPGVPILTTDFFEFGTTTNELWLEGCCVEMDDAVIAMVCERERPNTKYGFLRNVSDPVINGHLPKNLQAAWAVVTYQMKGLYTSFNSAVATWAMVAGS